MTPHSINWPSKILTLGCLLGVVFLIRADERPPLTVGLTGKYPPFNYFESNGQLIGFDVEVAKALCQRLGRRCDFKILQWDGILGALLSRRIDAVIASMAVTEERSRAVRFTRPYYTSGAQLFVASKTAANPLQEGFRIGVTLGTTYGEFAKTRYPSATVSTFKGDIEVLQDLQAGRLDGLITDKLVGLHMRQALGAPIAPIGPLLFEERIAIPVHPTALTLLNELNEALDSLRESKDYDRIWARYFGPNPVIAHNTWSAWKMAQLLLKALTNTLLVSLWGIGLGFVIATIVSVVLLQSSKVVSHAVALAVDFIRATPFMIQLFALYFGLPPLGIQLSAWNAAILAIGIHSAAYLAEIFKTAYQAVPVGQRWAAKTLGLTANETLTRVVFPQMLPLLTVPVLNTVVAMIKDSAIVSVISVHELTLQAQELISATFKPLELYTAVALLYFALTYPLLLLGRRMEKGYRRKGLLHVD